jgi:hypothetical protein
MMADDQDDLGQIRRLIRDAAPTLLIQTKKGAYPYEVGNKLVLPRAFSASTNAMVAHCVACIGGLLASNSRLVGFPLLPDRDHIVSASLRECAYNAVCRLIGEMNSVGEGGAVFNSTAFGWDDPFTVGWMIELLDSAQDWRLSCSREDVDAAFRRVRSVAQRRVKNALRTPNRPVLDLDPKKSERAVLHPMPLLRMVQVANLLEAVDGSQSFAELLPDVFEWFLTHLHLQLSRRNIQHGGFDIAELVFCLEGMLAAGRARVTRAIVDGVVGALNEARQLNSTLRATTPFKVTTVGAVHLFTSVEVVASLLRSAVLLERHDQAGFFVELKPALRHYLSWLQATMLRGLAAPPDANDEAVDPYPANGPRRFAGWQSEHAHTDDNSVHVWITSQIILFLRAYETLLSNDVAEAALRSAGIQLEGAAELTPGAAPSVEDRRAAALRDDPLQLDPSSRYRTVSRLNELFIEPRLSGWAVDAAYSCLMYGPPGTGKTTLARRVAADLGWPLLTITTSDFIIDGEAQVEARAKRIFQTLDLQAGIVIFFDEIDRLLMDRDMPSYVQQGDMLQFMTPSMLTKINDLRQAERSIFLIGTNYADRIDRAIKRAGRIDHKFLVLPPDRAKRRQLLETELERVSGEPLAAGVNIDEAARVGVGRTVAELRSAVRSFVRGGEAGDLVQHVRSVVPVLSLNAYRQRLENLEASLPEIVESHNELLEESYMVAYLMSESGDADVRRPEFAWLAEYWVGVRGYGIIQDLDVVARLNEFFR